MGIFKKNDTPPDTHAVATHIFERTYTNAERFKGFRRLHVTVYQDYQNAEQNALDLLQIKDPYDCKGQIITLTGIDSGDGQFCGIKVSADGIPLGVVWYHYDDDPLFLATYAGQIEGVFLRIESADPHPKVSLFVKLP